MNKKPVMIASYFTLAGDILPLTGVTVSPHALEVRAAAAAKAGYRGLGLLTDDLRHAVERHGFGGVRTILDDHGIEYLELEALMDWFAEGERRAIADRDRAFLFEAAEKLGAYHIKAVGDLMGGDVPLDRMIEGFSALCAEAREAGTRVVLEIFPVTNIRDLPTATALVKGAGSEAGGILLDVWHLNRGGIPYEDIATIPPGFIKHIELDDALSEPVGTLMEDTIERRLLPGEGELDVPSFLREVLKTGYDGIYGVEVLSEKHRKLPVEEAARRSYDAALKQFELATALI